MKFSIIIPCHNIEDYVGYCLMTVLSQTYSEFEVLCICDKCTDKTKEIIEGTNDSRVKIFETNFGCAGLPRNVGLDNCTGEWIWFIDGDDWIITPYALKELAEIIDTVPDIDILNYNFLWHYEIQRILANGGKLWHNVWSRLFKRDIIGNTRFNQNRIGEDFVFFKEIIAKNPQIHDSNKLLYFYNNPRIGSITYDHWVNNK